MDTHAFFSRPSFTGGRLRLRTLVFLRWLAIGGQTASLVLVHAGLGFDLPILLCLGVIALSVGLNVGLTVRYPANHRLNNFDAGLLLGYDILQLAALLYLTGGLHNPFSFLFLVPATVSAAALPLRYTLALDGLTLWSASIIAFFHFPLPWYPGRSLELDTVYLAGVWAALVIGLLFITFYAWRIASEARHMSDALAATEFFLAREQQLSALDGMAAAAAHELGTPLGTIAITITELGRELEDREDLSEDIELLRSQINRCRSILGELTDKGRKPDALLDRLSLSEMMAEIATNHDEEYSAQIELTSEPMGDGCGNEPETWRNPGILYALGNILTNAVEFAISSVSVDVRWTAYDVMVTITDDGPGFADSVLQKLGEPFITTRHEAGDKRSEVSSSGMGLGLFIARTLLERSGAKVTIHNRLLPDHGAIIEIKWPRVAFEAVKHHDA